MNQDVQVFWTVFLKSCQFKLQTQKKALAKASAFFNEINPLRDL